MRTPTARRTLSAFVATAAAFAASGAAVTGCGDELPTYTVAGKALVVSQQNFGAADYFCNPLANGQFMVVLSDFDLCSQVHQGNKSAPIFHGITETNLRLVFPSGNLKRVPPENVFKVGKADCGKNTTDPADTEAIALFSHSTAGMRDYDVSARATSGTITLLYPGANPGELKGSFDLTFEGGEHAKGSFDALYCKGTPGIGIGFGD